MDWARTPTGQWVRVLSSTAMLPNRERDKWRVEDSLGLSEFGDTTTEFYAVKSGMVPAALGYDRIVYGDHGPYLEFSSHQICWSSFPNFVEKPPASYYDECYTVDGLTMLYAQKRHVTKKPNPPSGAWSVANNRSEGYANYLVGKYYLACEADTVAVQRPEGRRRKRAGKSVKRQYDANAANQDYVEPEWLEGEETFEGNPQTFEGGQEACEGVPVLEEDFGHLAGGGGGFEMFHVQQPGEWAEMPAGEAMPWAPLASETGWAEHWPSGGYVEVGVPENAWQGDIPNWEQDHSTWADVSSHVAWANEGDGQTMQWTS